MKIVVTGGSGFIGTNLIDFFKNLNFELINYDIISPRNKEQFKFWRKIDICNFKDLMSNLILDSPDYIVHLAARTDLDEYKDLRKYNSNIDGVRNLMESALKLKALKKVVVCSSMLVCKPGYNPKSFDDYAPNCLYGESKVLTEKIVKEYLINWTIIRPTSIWGPWFGKPYKDFFKLVLSGFYFNIPVKYSSTKTYGYVENICYQIYKLMISEDPKVLHNYYYLGDLKPLNISEWAEKICRLNNKSTPFILPIWFIYLMAKLGDFLKYFFSVNDFPINSYRFNNITNNNIIDDLKRTIDLIETETDTETEEKLDFDQQIIKTVKWLKIN